MLGTVNIAWARMFRFPEYETSRDRIVFFSGVAAVLIAGLGTVIPNILNYLGDLRFVAAAVILLGLGLLWHSGVMRRVSHLTYYVTYHGLEGPRPSGSLSIQNFKAHLR